MVTAPAAPTTDSFAAFLDVFKEHDSPAQPPGGREALKLLCEKHKQNAAKAALMGGGGSGTSEELSGLEAAVRGSAEALCRYTHGFTAGAGPSLKESLRQLCSAVVDPSRELIGRVKAGADATELRRLVGEVWAGCDALCRCALDNKGVLFRGLADVMAGVKAAAKELDELIAVSREELVAATATQQQREGGEEGADDGRAGGSGDASSTGQGSGEEDEEDDEEDEDDFRDMGSLSASELAVAEAAAQLLAAAEGVMRAVSRPLLQGPPVTPEHCLDDWESMGWHAGKLRSGAEGLVATLYPPHEEEDVEELLGAGEAVANTLDLMLEEFPEAYLEEPQEQGQEGQGPQEQGPQGGQQGAAGLRQRLAEAEVAVEVAAGKFREALRREGRAVDASEDG